MNADAGFDEFFRAEFGRLAASLVLLGTDRPMAEEFAQEALYRAYRAWDRVAKMEHPQAWLYTVGLNLVRRHHRLRPHRPIVDHAGAGPDAPGMGAELTAAIARLPLDQRMVVVLRHVLGYPTEEAATILRRSPDATRALLHRAVSTLRRDAALVSTRDAEASRT